MVAYTIPSFLMFSTCITEIHYVVTSVWRSYIIGQYIFLFLNLNQYLAIVALFSVVTTYLRLNAGDWNWWWPAF